MKDSIKRQRQEKIAELIEDYEIETQEELAGRLGAAGFRATQATISRDIRELQLSKVPVGGGRQKYVAFSADDEHLADRYIRVLKEGYVSMALAQNLLVMKTVSGMAMAVAAAVDALKIEEIVGCIAGDNTIMMAMQSGEKAAAVMDRLERMIGR